MIFLRKCGRSQRTLLSYCFYLKVSKTIALRNFDSLASLASGIPSAPNKRRTSSLAVLYISGYNASWQSNDANVVAVVSFPVDNGKNLFRGTKKMHPPNIISFQITHQQI